MNFDKRKYTYIAIVAVIAIATIYVTYSLVKDGSPTVKSQNEYLVEANKLHKDSLYEAAVEPYLKAANFEKQRGLVNYNTATNSIMKNFAPLSKSFNEEGYQLDAAIDSALVDAASRLRYAGEYVMDSADYSSVFHNIGVTNHMRNDLTAAADAYKEALRKNPADEDARYNLAVILHQMKNNGQQNQENQENQQQDQQQEQQNQQQEQQNQQNQQQQQDQQQQDQQQQKENYERMLEALMQDEKELREKMDEEKAVQGIKMNLEKNW